MSSSQREQQRGGAEKWPQPFGRGRFCPLAALIARQWLPNQHRANALMPSAPFGLPCGQSVSASRRLPENKIAKRAALL
jgi:hypothetical protein